MDLKEANLCFQRLTTPIVFLFFSRRKLPNPFTLSSTSEMSFLSLFMFSVSFLLSRYGRNKGERSFFTHFHEVAFFLFIFSLVLDAGKSQKYHGLRDTYVLVYFVVG